MYDYDAALTMLETDDSPEATQTRDEVEAAKKSAVVWADNSTVSHIFYHSLIVDPARAFAASNPTRQGYAEYMVTQREFEAQLRQMHERGFVLVHPQRLVAPDAAGVMRYQPVLLPPGRTPLVLSVDDVSYYEYMAGAGFASNLTIRDGRVTNTYVDARGQAHHGAYDVSTVVDDFVRDHPEFSYRGDKGTIGLTGYNGVLGYRTSVRQYGNTAATREQQRLAKAVADAMKADGWHFASHTWGHINLWKSSAGNVAWDIEHWASEVRPIIGPTEEFIFPFGVDGYGSVAFERPGSKYPQLLEAGFRHFFPIDSTRSSWTQLTPELWRQMRIAVDGTSMSWALGNPKNPLHQFFDVKSTIDPARPA
ncbi:polysaccharide deacetylase family protein [Aestuariimicrobium ganziense]|uniref:polysaccharide deacetylase family protein n=1 Tax=Aestuariimicrobium ganziense TaxID=2773677 RepID=UPI00194147F1|nr:polysaccharide deacetylase family protein [Aestuariimicrobium ganziense]